VAFRIDYLEITLQPEGAMVVHSDAAGHPHLEVSRVSPSLTASLTPIPSARNSEQLIIQEQLTLQPFDG
jgi:hypothetical protein